MSEDFSRLIEESISKLQVKSGAIIMGTVIDVKKDLVIVNAGLKSEGMIPIDQFIGFDGNVEVKEGDTVKADQALTNNPNVGGFGQAETEVVLQNPARIQGLLAFFVTILLAQVFLVIKKKQFEKVQLAEMNF